MERTREGNTSVKVYPFMEIGTYVLSCPLPLPLSPFIGSNTAVTSIIWACVCVCACVGSDFIFVLRCCHYGRLLPFRVYKSFLLSLWIPLSNVCWSPFHQTAWNVCRMWVCVVIHRGQAEKEGRGHCLSRGGGADSLPLLSEEIWPKGSCQLPWDHMWQKRATSV